jgi:ankyrin repeat protein
MDLGIDVNDHCLVAMTEFKCTALSTACRSRNIEMVQLLLSCNADPNIPEVTWNSDGRITSSHAPLWVAVGIGRSSSRTHSTEYSTELVRLLIEAGADVMDTVQGSNMIHYAGHRGDLFLVKKLLEGGVDLHARDHNYWGKSALHCAVEGGNVEIIRLLVEHGLDILEKDFWGANAFHRAVAHDQVAVVETFIALGVDFLLKDKQGMTMMHRAAYYNSAEVIQFFLTKGLFQVDDITLYSAAKAASERVLRLLVKHGVDVNSADEEGWTALHLVVKSDSRFENRVACVQLLLNGGANVNERNREGDTPLLLAVARRNHYISKLLVERGADVRHRNHRGDSALSLSQYHTGDDLETLSEDEQGIRNLFAEYYLEDLVMPIETL